MPLRGIGEALGYNVQWHPDSREITLANETRVIRMTIGAASATVNVFGDGIPAETAALDVPPRIVNGRTYIPLRFVAENCGAQVEWNETEKTARIESAPFGVELTADTVNGGRTGVFLRRQTLFYDIESIEGDVTLPTVSLGEKGDCPYVYFGFDQIDDKGNAEGGLQYIEDDSRPDFGKWTVFLRQGDAWHWGENIVLEPGSAHHLKFFIENESDLVVELDGREVIRKPSAAVGFVQPSVKYVIAMAMSKPFDGTNCLSRLDNAKVTNLKADGEDFDRLSRQPEWRPGVGSVGMQFGSADCVPAYVHMAEDGYVSLYKQ
jgi:hypothetical protein